GDIGRGLAPRADDVDSPVFFGDRALLRVSSDRDHPRTGTEKLGILDRIKAEAARAEYSHHPIGPESTGVEKLLDASVGRHAGVGERRELLELELLVDLDQISGRNGNELGESTVLAEAWPADVGTDLSIADLAVPTGAVPPA